jgi:hypothetical protein
MSADSEEYRWDVTPCSLVQVYEISKDLTACINKLEELALLLFLAD